MAENFVNIIREIRGSTNDPATDTSCIYGDMKSMHKEYNGFKQITDEERLKLENIEEGATKNSSDAFLLSRANHTGNMSIANVQDTPSRMAMTIHEKNKLDGMIPDATKNDSDANLRNRATHTGTQSADTIVDGLVNAAFTNAEKVKLAVLDITKPPKHLHHMNEITLGDLDASRIAESSAQQFVSSAEKDRISGSEQSANRGVPNGYAPLGPNGKINPSYLEALNVIDVFTPVDFEAMLLLSSAKPGDIAYVQDDLKTYMLIGLPSNNHLNWKELNSAASVISINGLTGAVSISSDDLPEGTVNKYFTGNRVTNEVKEFIRAGTNVTVSYNPATNKLTIDSDTTVGSLVDVDLTTVPVEDGQTIVWNEVEGKWLPGDSNPVSAVINKPVITSPVNLTVGYIGAVTSIYSTGVFYGGLQTQVIWECALDVNFNDIVDSYEGSSNLTSWTPSVGLALTQVFIRTKQISDGHRSEFSDTVSFTTPDTYIQTPTISISGNLSGLVLTPTISLSAFSVFNGSDTHVSTDYQVVDKVTGVVKWKSLGNTVDKLGITTGQLDIQTEYTFRARFNGQTYGSSSWVEIDGTTVNIYVVTPTLTVQGHPLDIGKNPTLTTSAFTIYNGSDVHLSTDYQILKNSDGSLVWESLGNTANKLTINSGDLVKSTEYRFRARHNSTNYGSSAWVEVIGTTKASFSTEYGLQWNNTADTYTRLGAAASWTTGADFTNNATVQSRMRRCVLNANGTVNYYLSATDSTKREDGVTAADLTGASGNVMVEIPKFWVKYDNTTSAKQMWISTAPAIGYVVHPWFVKNGVEVDYRYYRAYKGSVSGTKLISRSGVAAANSETIAAFRTKAQANGTGWGLVDWNSIFAVQTLLFIEIGTFNSQSILGNGNDTGSDYGMTTGGSNSIGNASSPSTNDDTWMSYRGIENFYADIFEWIDGINISERLVYTSNTQSTFASNVFSGAYTSTGVTLPSTNGYIKDMSFSIKGFIPTVATGSDSTYVTDYVNSTAGARVAAFGGAASYGLMCGAACLDTDFHSSYVYPHAGAGLSF